MTLKDGKSKDGNVIKRIDFLGRYNCDNYRDLNRTDRMNSIFIIRCFEEGNANVGKFR